MENGIASVVSVLETTPQRWIRLAEALPPELFARRPAPGEWSACECLAHLVDTERMVFPQRVGHLLRGEDFPAFYPDAEGTKTAGTANAAGLAREFGRLRSESLAVLATVAPEDLPRTARHQELGIVTLGELLNEWAGHDLMHTMQAEKALLQPFIAGCPPWRSYFKDHVIG